MTSSSPIATLYPILQGAQMQAGSPDRIYRLYRWPESYAATICLANADYAAQQFPPDQRLVSLAVRF